MKNNKIIILTTAGIFLLLVILAVSGILFYSIFAINSQNLESNTEIKSENSLVKDSNSKNQISNESENQITEDGGSCIITVSGEKYDVTDFKNRHSGGDIFECGVDMTNVFNSQHGSDLDRIKPYKVD